jgi:hypothetical protein
VSTDFQPIEIPPGVVATATKRMRSSNWAEVNLVRWREGQLSPVGGQQQYNYSFASRCKRVHGWYSTTGLYHIAYLCETNLYVDIAGTLVDITPPGGMAPPSFGSGGYGSAAYGSGDYGTPRPLSPVAALDRVPDTYSLSNFGGLLLAMTSPDQRLLMWDPGLGQTLVDGELAATAAWTTASPSIPMVANPGWVVPGMGVFNTTTNQQVGIVLTYTGSTLVLTANAATASDGAADVLHFGNMAVPVTAPTGFGVVPLGRCFVVTPERFVIIFGAVDPINGGGFRRFAWCDQENPTSWNYSDVTSQAGFLDIEPASPIITAISTRSGTLFWTGKKAYNSQFLGIPYVYNYVELADNCTPWSPQSMVTTSAMVLWMSEQGMFSYDGTSILPAACAVRAWIDDDIDPVNVREQSCAVHVENYNEIWWFFPQKGQPYNTRAAIYNYKEGWWSQARMSRSAGVTAAYNSHTIMTNGAVAFQHELANYYSSDAELPWAETFDVKFGPDAKLTTVKQLIPNIETLELTDPGQIAAAIGAVRYSLFYRNSRSLGTPERQTTPRPVRNDGYVDFRTTGRDIRLRFDVLGPAVPPITVGQHLIDAVLRGDR